MDYSGNTILLFAEAATSGQPGFGDLLRGPLVPMIILMVGMLYVMNRSQSKKAREHAELLKSVKPGDKILTNSGIIASVITVKEKTVTIRSMDTKLEIAKGAIAEITERGTDTKET